MSDELSTSISIIIELGLPIVFLWLCFKSGRLQNLGLVLLGSCSIWLVIYFLISANHLLGLSKDDFAFSAVWVMTLIPYISTIAIGIGLFFVSNRFTKKWQKFSLGVFSFVVVATSIYVLR